jgi:hypothetical protein
MVPSLFFRSTEKIIISSLLPFLLVIACSGTDKGNEPFLKVYGGNPYMGTVQVDIILPNGKYVHTNYGKGSSQFIRAGKDKVQMILFGAISNEKGDAGFVLDGNCEKLNWQYRSDSAQLRISEQGAISGAGKRFPQQYDFSGKISDVRLELTTELKTLVKSENGYPAGTRFVFKYVLRRDIATASKGTTKGNCKKIAWRPQYIGNFDGSGTTVQIPYCAD